MFSILTRGASKPASSCGGGCATPAEQLQYIESVIAAGSDSYDQAVYGRAQTPRLWPVVVTESRAVRSLTTDQAAIVPAWNMIASGIAVLPRHCDAVSDWVPITGVGATGSFALTVEASHVGSNGGTAEYPILGYEVRISYTASDELTAMRIKLSGVTNDLAEITANSDLGNSAVVFLPTVASGAVTTHNGTTVYSNSIVAADLSDVTFQILSNGANATSLGGWTVDYRPIFAFTENV